MDTNVSKDDNKSDNMVKNVAENDRTSSADSVSICIKYDAKEKSKIPNDLDQLNETILNVPLPRTENVKRSEQSDRENNLFGILKSENQNDSRAIWVQFMAGKVAPSEGPPLYYDPETRNYFVRKVFFILTIMMLTTFAIVILFYLPPLNDIFKIYWLFFVIPAMIVSLGVSYAFACSQCSRNPPCNYICLLLTVLSMSIICAFVTMRYDTKIIIYAVLATTVAVFICSLLALTTFDFTSWLLYVILISLALMALTMILMVANLAFGFYMKPLHIVILVAGLILNCVFLVIELQMVLGGKKVELSEDDYALGAYMLYTSVIEIFLTFVRLFGLLSDE